MFAQSPRRQRRAYTHILGSGEQITSESVAGIQCPLMKAFLSWIDYGVKMSFCRGLEIKRVLEGLQVQTACIRVLAQAGSSFVILGK